MTMSGKGAHVPQAIIVMGSRGYRASPLRSRQVEALLAERGGRLDHTTSQRWVVQDSPGLAEAFPRRQRPVWVSGRMDETDLKSNGQWSDRDRAVATTGQTSDGLLTEQRDEQAAKRWRIKAIRRHGGPEQIPLDGSAAHKAASERSKEAHDTTLASRHIQELPNLGVHDHQGGKRLPRPR